MIRFLILGPDHLLKCVAGQFPRNEFILQEEVESSWGVPRKQPDRLKDPEIDIVVFDPNGFSEKEVNTVMKACNGKLVIIKRGGMRAPIQAKLEELKGDQK